MVNGGWISTYAVMAKIANKKQAALFTAVFWLAYTIVLYISGCIKSKESTKMKRFT